jgi:DNA primase
MTKNWVDFNEIKENVSMEMVLNHYGLVDKLKKSGKNLVGCCPIHKGSNNRQFSVNLERNIFNCFGNCKSGGNIIDNGITIT